MSQISNAAHAVRTQGLSKRYGREQALDSVDLHVPDGAIYVLVGANGAGKSTLIRILLNLVRPDAGLAEIFGVDTGDAGARAQIGYVPEHQAHGYRWMTSGRLIQHVAAFYPSWDHEYANHLIANFGLRLDRKVGTLSKGEARRVQIVTALAHRPPLLLLDEPTDGLDPLMRKRLLVLLTEHLADSPTTVLISTHQIYEMESLADHVGVLSGGRLVTQMSRDELHRTVLRYDVAIPEGWRAPQDLVLGDVRRSTAGREARLTVVGDERTVTERLTSTGAQVRGVTSLGLEDAALTFMEEVS